MHNARCTSEVGGDTKGGITTRNAHQKRCTSAARHISSNAHQQSAGKSNGGHAQCTTHNAYRTSAGKPKGATHNAHHKSAGKRTGSMHNAQSDNVYQKSAAQKRGAGECRIRTHRRRNSTLRVKYSGGGKDADPRMS